MPQFQSRVSQDIFSSAGINLSSMCFPSEGSTAWQNVQRCFFIPQPPLGFSQSCMKRDCTPHESSIRQCSLMCRLLKCWQQQVKVQKPSCLVASFQAKYYFTFPFLPMVISKMLHGNRSGSSLLLPPTDAHVFYSL